MEMGITGNESEPSEIHINDYAGDLIKVPSSNEPESDNSDKLDIFPKRIKTLDHKSLGLGSVNVNNSSDVHFGNKTFINGPVTINQVYTSKLDVREVEKDVSNSKSYSADENTSILKKFSNKITVNTVTVSLLIITLMVALFMVLGFYWNNSYKSDSVLNINNTDTDLPLQWNNLRIVSRLEWIAQPPEEEITPLEHPVPMVIIAHTATENCSTQSDCVHLVRLVQTFHIESKKWSDIAYNFLVGGDGSAYVGRGWNGQGAHTKYFNSKSIGIAFLGTFNHVKPPVKQLEACQALIDMGVKMNKISSDYKLYGHRQMYSTLSPGDELYKIIQQWPHWSTR